MENKEFMDLVRRELKESMGKNLPPQNSGASYNDVYSDRDSKSNGIVIGVCSGIYNRPVFLKWGVEIVFPEISRVEQVSSDHLRPGIKRGYVSFDERLRKRTVYRITSTDLETVTDTENNGLRLSPLPGTSQVPTLKGMKLEEALPILFNTFY